MQNGSVSANSGNLGDKKFLINATWWRKWCDYVNFTSESVTDVASDNESYDPATTFYDKPSRIDNI